MDEMTWTDPQLKARYERNLKAMEQRRAAHPELLNKWAVPYKVFTRSSLHGIQNMRINWLMDNHPQQFREMMMANSEVIQDLIARKYHRRERVHLIYNGVPKPEICDYPEYFEELGIEEGKYILGMCRFVPEKNLHHLIEAFKKLEAGDCKLVLAGDTDFEDEYSLGLKKMAQEAGVVLTGFVKGHKLHSLLTNARCYCLPSSHEGLPIALLEAMSYHLPVVVSNIPANLEVGLSSDCYFHCGDVDALAARLQKVIDEDYHSVQYDMAPYDWDKIAKQVMGVYEGLLK